RRPYSACRVGMLLYVVAFALPLLGFAKTPALTDLKVFPADVNLKTRQDRQAIVVQAIFADGITRDVTSQSSYSVANKSLVKFEKFTLTPVADGLTELKVKFQGKALTVPVKVENAKTEEPISFTLDVMPVFTKAGCNTGSCHG